MQIMHKVGHMADGGFLQSLLVDDPNLLIWSLLTWAAYFNVHFHYIAWIVRLGRYICRCWVEVRT